MLFHLGNGFLQKFLGGVSLNGPMEQSEVTSQFICFLHQAYLEPAVGYAEGCGHPGNAAAQHQCLLVDTRCGCQ